MVELAAIHVIGEMSDEGGREKKGENKNDIVAIRVHTYYDWSRISFFSLNITASSGGRGEDREE